MLESSSSASSVGKHKISKQRGQSRDLRPVEIWVRSPVSLPSIMLLTSSDILATAKGTGNESPSLLICKIKRNQVRHRQSRTLHSDVRICLNRSWLFLRLSTGRIVLTRFTVASPSTSMVNAFTLETFDPNERARF